MQKPSDLAVISKGDDKPAPSRRKSVGIMGQVRQFADRVVESISPRRIILFGSHARNAAGPDSDVDILVITDHPSKPDASLELRRKIEYAFPLDLIVCDVKRLEDRIKAGDYFLQDAVESGKVLYERPDC